MMAAKGAIHSVYELMKEHGVSLRQGRASLY